MSSEMKSCFTGSSTITTLEMEGVVLLSDLEKLFLPWKIRLCLCCPGER